MEVADIIAELRSKISEFEGKIEGAEANRDSLNEQIQEVEGELTDYDSSIKELEIMIEDLKRIYDYEEPDPDSVPTEQEQEDIGDGGEGGE